MAPILSCVESEVKNIYDIKSSMTDNVCPSQRDSMQINLASRHYHISNYKDTTAVSQPPSHLIQARNSKLKQRGNIYEGFLYIHDRCPPPPKARRRFLPNPGMHCAMSAQRHSKVTKQIRHFRRQLQTEGKIVVLAIL